MKAIIVANDAEHTLSWQDVPGPTCSPHQALVDIHATAVNRADLLQRSGNYPPPYGAPPYMGLEMSGTITAVGDDVENFRPGDRVFGLLTGGGYAEQVAVPATHLLPLPDERDFAWGAAIAEVFLTSFTNLFIEAGLQEGETVLIHGGASGVGTAAIQLCREAGCKVLITAGTNAKILVLELVLVSILVLPWLVMACLGRPWPAAAVAGHGRPCQPWLAMAARGRPRPGMAGHMTGHGRHGHPVFQYWSMAPLPARSNQYPKFHILAKPIPISDN